MTGNQTKDKARIAIFYEHPQWFRPMFAELDRRGVAYDEQLCYSHQFDPEDRRPNYALIVNRMSPSAYLRGHTNAIQYSLEYLAYLKAIKANVLNGFDAYQYEFSKARQLNLLQRLGIRYPRARIINHASQVIAATEGLTFPIVVKPNIGGSGAGIQLFESALALKEAVAEEEVELGIDHVALVQEYLPARGNSIVRVEVLNGEFLYAIRLHLDQVVPNFNLCPADYCRVPKDESSNGSADGVSGRSLLVEGYTPPDMVIKTILRIANAAQIEVGGIEYLVNDRDGEVYYYDINALSNFVADAPNVIGFDPFLRLVDYITTRAGLA